VIADESESDAGHGRALRTATHPFEAFVLRPSVRYRCFLVASFATTAADVQHLAKVVPQLQFPPQLLTVVLLSAQRCDSSRSDADANGRAEFGAAQVAALERSGHSVLVVRRCAVGAHTLAASALAEAIGRDDFVAWIDERPIELPPYLLQRAIGALLRRDTGVGDESEERAADVVVPDVVVEHGGFSMDFRTHALEPPACFRARTRVFASQRVRTEHRAGALPLRSAASALPPAKSFAVRTTAAYVRVLSLRRRTSSEWSALTFRPPRTLTRRRPTRRAEAQTTAAHRL
jgi:hypothetical protein